MALVPCRECGVPISRRAIACPHSGHTRPKPIGCFSLLGMAVLLVWRSHNVRVDLAYLLPRPRFTNRTSERLFPGRPPEAETPSKFDSNLSPAWRYGSGG